MCLDDAETEGDDVVMRRWVMMGAMVGLSLSCTTLVGLDKDYVRGWDIEGDGSSTEGSSSAASGGGSGGATFSVCGFNGYGGCPVNMVSACCYHNDLDLTECVQEEQFNPSEPGASTTMCKTAAEAGGFATRIKCQLPEHCPAGTVCCANRVEPELGTYYKSVTCQTTCGPPDHVICGKEGEEGPTCPVLDNPPYFSGQSVCTPSTLLPYGFLVCAQP